MKHSGSPDISVVLPVGGCDRLPQFRTVLAALCGQKHRNFEIIAVEMGREPRYRSECPAAVKYLFISQDGDTQFNKCKAMNYGVMNAQANLVLLHDADIVPPAGYLDRIIGCLNSGWDAIRPMRLLFCLDKQDSENFCRNWQVVLPDRVELVRQNFAGGSTAVRKEIYDEIGGHDERFSGWASEDLEFIERLKTTRFFPGSDVPAIHLWHPSAPNKISRNPADDFAEEIRHIPVSDRIRYLRDRQA